MNEDLSKQPTAESRKHGSVKLNLVAAPLNAALQPLTTTSQNPRGSWGQRLVASYIQETSQYGRVMILFPGFDMVLRMDEQLESYKLERKCRLVSVATIAILGCCSLLHLQIADWCGAHGMNLDGVLLVISTSIVATVVTVRVIFHAELKSAARLVFRLGMLQAPSSSAFFLLLCALLLLTGCSLRLAAACHHYAWSHSLLAQQALKR